MSIDFSIFIEYLPYLLVGFWLTIKIVAGALLLGLPFGLVLALGRKSNFFIPRFAATSFIEIFRNTPFIIQVFLFYYVLPFYGIRFDKNHTAGNSATAATVLYNETLMDFPKAYTNDTLETKSQIIIHNGINTLGQKVKIMERDLKINLVFLNNQNGSRMPEGLEILKLA